MCATEAKVTAGDEVRRQEGAGFVRAVAARTKRPERSGWWVVAVATKHPAAKKEAETTKSHYDKGLTANVSDLTRIDEARRLAGIARRTAARGSFFARRANRPRRSPGGPRCWRRKSIYTLDQQPRATRGR